MVLNWGAYVNFQRGASPNMLYNTIFINFNNQNDRELDLRKKPSVLRSLRFCTASFTSAKMLMQDLCSRGLGWDETISPSDIRRWNNWLDSLPALQDVEILRCVKPPAFEVKSSQLHCLCDASQTGYGAVIYMRSVSVTGEIHCSFIVVRSRVAFIKPGTIPCRELVAAVVGVELTTFLKRELELKSNDIVFWTDCTSVLQCNIQ